MSRFCLKSYPLLRSLALYRLMPYQFAGCASLFLLANLSFALQQVLVGQALDRLKHSRADLLFSQAISHPSNPWFWFMLLLSIAACRAVLQYCAAISALSIGQNLLTILREKIFNQVQDLDIAWHWQHGLAEVITRTTRDSDKLKEALLSFWRQVFDAAVVLMLSLAVLCWLHPLLGLVPLLLIVLGLWLLSKITSRLVALEQQVGRAYEQVSDLLAESIYGVRVVKAFALADRLSLRFNGSLAYFIQHSIKAIAFAAKYLPLPQIIIALSYVWVMGFAAYLLSRAELQMGEFVTALLLVNMLVFRVESIGQVLHVFADARASAMRIWQMLDVEAQIQDGTQLLAIPAGQGLALKLQQVSFHPAQHRQAILKHLNVLFPAGQIITIVGKTGAGKSSLMNLFNRFFDPSAGQILLGSDQAGWMDIKQLKLAQLRSVIQIVPQENFFFSGTLAENLRVAKPEATEQQLLEVLAQACASEVLQRLDQGLDTRIGDKGVTLSGGQKQRLALARALLKAPQILALDDATSALDAKTEKMLLLGLKQLAQHSHHMLQPMTIIINSHKHSTIALSDWVVVLDQGQVLAQGSPEQLRRDSAFYRQLMAYAPLAPAMSPLSNLESNHANSSAP
jgi:ATP-binding cassette subfamily B protein